MPFLDVCVKIDGNEFCTSVYRKTTHTGVFLNFLAYAPTAWKKGVILCLLHRAKMICSSVSLFIAEIDNLRKMFISNSYSLKFFNDMLTNFLNRLNVSSADSDDNVVDGNDNTPIITFNVPYFSKCSKSFANSIATLISRKFSVKVRVVYSTFKIQSYFVLKCFSPLYLSSNVVYRFDSASDSCTDYRIYQQTFV